MSEQTQPRWRSDCQGRLRSSGKADVRTDYERKLGWWVVCQHCQNANSDANVRTDRTWMVKEMSGQTKIGWQGGREDRLSSEG